MKVGTLVRYELNESRPLGVITAVAEYTDPKTGKNIKRIAFIGIIIKAQRIESLRLIMKMS